MPNRQNRIISIGSKEIIGHSYLQARWPVLPEGEVFYALGEWAGKPKHDQRLCFDRIRCCIIVSRGTMMR